MSLAFNPQGKIAAPGLDRHRGRFAAPIIHNQHFKRWPRRLGGQGPKALVEWRPIVERANNYTEQRRRLWGWVKPGHQTLLSWPALLAPVLPAEIRLPKQFPT